MSSRLRDVMTEPLTMEYVKRRTDEGWMAAAVEWVKTAEPEPVDEFDLLQEPAYGQRVSGDCKHLIDDPLEMDTLYMIYEKVVAGWRPTLIAAELNSRGRRTRAGGKWTPNAVFDLLPRLIEVSPKLQMRSDWPERRAALEIVS